MNKLIIALSVACASACVFADVGATPKTETTPWFSAVANPEAITGGNFKAKPEIVEGKFVIDSEPTEPVTFTANEFDGSAKDMVEVEIKLDTAIVPSDARGDLSDKNAKVAFAASEDNDVRAYYAWVGSWKMLSGATPSETDGTPYTLLVTFDNRESTKKVQFKVDGTVLKDASGNEWLAYSPVVSTTMSIDLVGSGNVASLVGKQVTVTAEIIVVDGGTIDIKEEDMAAFKNAKPERYTTVDAFVAAPASEAFGSNKFKTTGITVGAAYALGLVEKATDADGEKMIPKDDGELKAHAIAESTAEGIKIGLNVTPRTDTGASVKFKIMQGEALFKDNLDAGDIVIPTKDLGTGLKIFKVQAVVTPKK